VPLALELDHLHKGLRGVATGAIACALFVLAPLSAQAGEYASLVELGTKFYSGTTTPSATGAYGFFLDLRAEKKKGFFRPTAAAEIEYAMGTARFSDDDLPTFTMMSGSFVGGINLFLFSESQILPFLGASGVLGWNVLKLTGQQAGVEANTQGLAYGYEISAGCDLRKSAGADDGIRVRTSFWQTSSTLAGAAGFQLSGWRISIGLMF
jgi:hypothetical protein